MQNSSLLSLNRCYRIDNWLKNRSRPSQLLNSVLKMGKLNRFMGAMPKSLPTWPFFFMILKEKSQTLYTSWHSILKPRLYCLQLYNVSVHAVFKYYHNFIINLTNLTLFLIKFCTQFIRSKGFKGNNSLYGNHKRKLTFLLCILFIRLSQIM